MHAPLVGAAQLRAAYSARGERVFERLRVPRRHRLRDRAGVVVALQKRQRAVARTESAVQMDPSPVARSIESRGEHATTIKRRALIAQVQERHERGCRGALVHFDALRTAAARAPQVGGGGGIRGEDCGSSFAGAKGSCDDRVVSDDLQRVLV